MTDSVKALLKSTPLYSFVWERRAARQIKEWQKAGHPIPAPHAVKQRIVREYASRFRAELFIETGTCLGEMVFAMKNVFTEIHSIELAEELADQARERFRRHQNVHILKGDSPSVLARLLPSISRSTLIWLDAHYSGGDTAKGEVDTPIMSELTVIFESLKSPYCLLIDDARCFNGKDGYPTIPQLKDFILKNRPTWVVEIEHDIIRAHFGKTQSQFS